jgi:hypothetical protein
MGVGKAIQGAIGGHTAQEAVKAESVGVRPEQKRALELEAKGVNPKEAAKQAYSELHPTSSTPTPEKTLAEVAKQASTPSLTQPTTEKTSEKSVPIDTTSIENDKEIVEELKKMEKILMKIEEEGGKGQTSINTTQSGYDAYNVRDPLLASLNSGTLDLA